MTWSPFLSEVTPGPTSTTTPVPSCPRIAGNSPSGSAPESVNSSVWQIPVAGISTIPSPALGPSSCTVSIESGAPAWCATAARTSMPASPLLCDAPRSWPTANQTAPQLASPSAVAGFLLRACRGNDFALATTAMHAATISHNGEVAMGRAIAFGTGLLGGLVMSIAAQAADLGTVRIGVLKFGTVNWELDVIQQHGLDAEEGFTLEVTDFASNDAADIALMGEAVDGIVEDWLWVSRQRAERVPLTFIPYSSSVGALVVPADGGIDTLADLDGKRLGIAGGPLDKSWLLIQAVAKEEEHLDLAEGAELVYGAPPLLAEKFKSGELDAVINYWHYAARLEAEGHKRLLDVTEAQESLGVPADTPQLGYVFREEWADQHAGLVKAFARASQAAKAIMDESDEEWERLRPLTQAENDAALDALKRRYREGIVRSWGEQERQAAGKLYGVLAELGGEELVGSSPVLVDGTFWPGVSY